MKPQESEAKKLKKLAGDLNLEGYKIVSKNYFESENIIYGFQIYIQQKTFGES